MPSFTSPCAGVILQENSGPAHPVCFSEAVASIAAQRALLSFEPLSFWKQGLPADHCRLSTALHLVMKLLSPQDLVSFPFLLK